MTFTQAQIDEMAITLADVNGYPWSSMLDGCGDNLGRAVASKTFYRRLAKAALQHSAETTSTHPVIRFPITDDSTSKHSTGLELTTNPDTQKGRPGDSQLSLTQTVLEDSGGNGTPGRPSLEGEPASVVVTGVGSLSSSGVLV